MRLCRGIAVLAETRIWLKIFRIRPYSIELINEYLEFLRMFVLQAFLMSRAFAYIVEHLGFKIVVCITPVKPGQSIDQTATLNVCQEIRI
jgi:hypothetical protein